MVSQRHDEVFKNSKFLAQVKEQCASYGYLRVKWNIARGFRYEVKSESDSEWVLQHKA